MHAPWKIFNVCLIGALTILGLVSIAKETPRISLIRNLSKKMTTLCEFRLLNHRLMCFLCYCLGKWLWCYKTLFCLQDENLGVCPLSSSSSQSVECSNHKSKTESFKSGSSISRVKSFLPVPRNKVNQFSQNIKCSSSNTRQTKAICN